MTDQLSIEETDPRLAPDYEDRQPFRDAIEDFLTHSETPRDYRQILASLAIDYDVDLSDVQSDKHHCFVSDSLKALHDLIAVENRVVVVESLLAHATKTGQVPEIGPVDVRAGILIRYELN